MKTKKCLQGYIGIKAEVRQRVIDRIGKETYETKLIENVNALVRKLKQMSYKSQPVRRAYIPKSNGKLRGLGIPACEDRLVQGVFAELLTEVYEPRFLPSSYGFRPERSAHDAVKEIVHCITQQPIGYQRIL